MFEDIFWTNAHIIIFERRYSEGNPNYMFASFIGDVLAYISIKKDAPIFPNKDIRNNTMIWKKLKRYPYWLKGIKYSMSKGNGSLLIYKAYHEIFADLGRMIAYSQVAQSFYIIFIH